jgi:3'-phosphoadenosine 5'-phosphosulfate sulfotransferase (PAPS reductase)/FAD synthetase
MPSFSELQMLQALPLEVKIAKSQARIREFYNKMSGNVYISFSGGKDSTVMAHLVHSVYPEVPMYFMNTGLEFPEIQKFCREQGATILRPERSFVDVITQYGYPLITKEIAEGIYFARRIINGKKRKATLTRTTLNKRREFLGQRVYVDTNGAVSMKNSRFNKTKYLALARDTDFMISNRCCFYMKKSDFGKMRRKQGIAPYVGTTAEESKLRTESWLMYGCNTFQEGHEASRPISFWTEQDILRYIYKFDVAYCPIYGEIVHDEVSDFYYVTAHKRTGCIFCLFGMHAAKGKSKFQELAESHPRQYEYCMSGGQYVDNPFFDPDAPEMDGEWKNWNPEKIWVPSKEGIGMQHVIDQVNRIYGTEFLKY